VSLATLAGALAVSVLIGGLHSTPAFAEESTQSCALFASTSGSDTSPGTQAAPFRTLSKLASSLAAGQTGCLQSGQTFDTEGNIKLSPGETHGKEGQPVTITSTNPAEPATITHSLGLEAGANYLTFTHLDFNWSMPKPWGCWDAAGDILRTSVILSPGVCIPGSANPEDAVQVGIGGTDDRFTYDDITSNDTNICVNVVQIGTQFHGEDDVLEHDRIHNCGPTVEPTSIGFALPNEEWGWHSHGIYDYGHDTVIKNNYLYENSRNGVLLNGGGEGAVVEHNIIDDNGAGVWFGSDRNSTVAWNIITNSTSPRQVADYGIGGYEPGSGNVATDNCLYGNLSGEIDAEGFTATNNKTDTNPLYVSASRHEYTLQAGSPCVGYGPDTAQPEGSGSGATAPPETSPAAETSRKGGSSGGSSTRTRGKRHRGAQTARASRTGRRHRIKRSRHAAKSARARLARRHRQEAQLARRHREAAQARVRRAG
jgi:hypothetical protein